MRETRIRAPRNRRARARMTPDLPADGRSSPLLIPFPPSRARGALKSRSRSLVALLLIPPLPRRDAPRADQERQRQRERERETAASLRFTLLFPIATIRFTAISRPVNHAATSRPRSASTTSNVCYALADPSSPCLLKRRPCHSRRKNPAVVVKVRPSPPTTKLIFHVSCERGITQASVTIQQIYIRADVPSKGSLNGGGTVSTILLRVSDPSSPSLCLTDTVIKGSYTRMRVSELTL